MRKYFPYIRYRKCVKTPEFDNWTCLGDGGLKEYKYAVSITVLKYTTTIEWAWAVNKYNQRTVSPFNNKSNHTVCYFNFGYLRIQVCN